MSKGDAIRRIHSNNCMVGQYAVINSSTVECYAPSFVAAEIKAHDLCRKNPSVHYTIAQVASQVIGVPHVYEVHGKGSE